MNKFEKLIDLIEIYNLTFILGIQIIQERLVKFITKSAINFHTIQSFIILNFKNEKLTEFSNKFNLICSKEDIKSMYDEINKLNGLLQITDDLNDFNVLF